MSIISDFIHTVAMTSIGLFLGGMAGHIFIYKIIHPYIIRSYLRRK